MLIRLLIIAQLAGCFTYRSALYGEERTRDGYLVATGVDAGLVVGLTIWSYFSPEADQSLPLWARLALATGGVLLADAVLGTAILTAQVIYEADQKEDMR